MTVEGTALSGFHCTYYSWLRPAGKLFKDTMQPLEAAARKVADAHLHTPIRKSETLPVAQQVNFASELDVLLSEIVRITR
jgi:hypothetical protein